MTMHLSTFEDGIDPRILSRGREYFVSGAVTRIRKEPDGKILATVAGSEIYHVELVLTNNDTVTSCRCTCPYEYREVCKHVVAVLFELKGRPTFESEGIDPDEEIASLEETLDGLTREELAELIREKASTDESWRALILTRYSGSDEKTQSARYDDMLMNADDSGGSIGYTIIDAVELLSRMTGLDLPNDARSAAFSLTTDRELLSKLAVYLWAWDLLRIGLELVRTDADERKLLLAADTLVRGENEWSRRSTEEERALLELELYRRRRTPEDCAAFIASNIRYPQFREMVLEDLFRNDEYERLLQVARDGVVLDAQSAPGSARQWQEWILKAAIRKNDTAVIREAAEALFLDRYGIEYFRILKQFTHPEIWPEERERLFHRLQENNYVLQTLYAEEGLLSRLKDSIWEHPTLDLLAKYLNLLLPEFWSETLTLLERLVFTYLHRQMGRKFYHYIAVLLGRLKRLGESEKAGQIARSLVDTYANRPALRDELSNEGLLDGGH